MSIIVPSFNLKTYMILDDSDTIETKITRLYNNVNLLILAVQMLSSGGWDGSAARTPG